MTTQNRSRPRIILQTALIVMLVSALLIGGCQVRDTWRRQKQMKTLNRIRALSKGIEDFAWTNRRYPEAKGTVHLDSVLASSYLPDVPRRDAWGNELQYSGTAEDYRIASAGGDGVFERQSLWEYPLGGTTQYDCDLVFQSAGWQQWPEGAPGGNP